MGRTQAGQKPQAKPSGGDALALHALADQFASAADRFGLLARALFRGLFVEFPALHFPERAFALHLLFERAQGLLDIIVADNDLNQRVLLLSTKRRVADKASLVARKRKLTGFRALEPPLAT
jgi:hypothetical protein